jgi:methylase of polypeptide subunit release factors
LPVELLVRPPTLIPRPETEHWLNQLIHRLVVGGGGSPPLRILDIGTGSGCIALGLTYALRNRKEDGVPTVQTVAVDQSTEALALAQENAHRCGLIGTPAGSTAPSRHDESSKSKAAAAAAPISFVLENLFSPTFTSWVLSALRGASSPSSAPRFDLVVSNPPYIPLHEYETLDASVREWEDRKALVGEMPPSVVEPAERRSIKQSKNEDEQDDGLVFYRRIISLLDTLLEPPPPPPLSLRSDSLSSNSDSTQKDSAQEQGPPPSPCVAFEVGKGQARAVERLLRAWRPSPRRHHDHSFSPDLDSQTHQQQWRLETEVLVDPWGVERAVFAHWARWKEEEEAPSSSSSS